MWFGTRKRVTFHVVFYGGILGGFWTPFLAPGWRHCFLIMTVFCPWPNVFARRYAVTMHPTAWGVDLDVYWRTPEEVAAEFIRAGATAVVKVTVEFPPQKRFALRGLITCVSVVKAVLGLRNWRVITPRQLYDELVALGGETTEAEYGGSSCAGDYRGGVGGGRRVHVEGNGARHAGHAEATADRA